MSKLELDKSWFGLRPKGVRRYMHRQQQLQQLELERLEDRKRLLQRELASYGQRRGNHEELVRIEEGTPSEIQAPPTEADENAHTARAELATDRAPAAEALPGEPAAAPSAPNLPERPAPSAKSVSSYWGNIDQYMNPWQPHPSPYSPPPVPAVPPVVRAAAEHADPPVRGFEHAGSEHSEWEAALIEQAAAAQDESAAAAGDASGSQAISEEIRQLRYKYIVGKIAGDDLYDRRGGLIIARNAVITADAVNKADREGKLADLIVSMIIPGLGEG